MIIPVVAAIIERDERILICQRRADDSLPLKWEFPGGKVKQSESLSDALVRELHEELGVAATVGELVAETEFSYGELQRTVKLYFFRATVEPGAELRNLAFEQFKWEAPSALPAYDFLPADREIVKRIASRQL